MGESKQNMTAVLAKTFPQFPPRGRALDVQIVPHVVPKLHVGLFHPERIRMESGKQQVLGDDGATWVDVSEGHVAHPLGTLLPPELLDIAFMPRCLWANVSVMRRGPNGMPIPASASYVGTGVEFFRMDYREFMDEAEKRAPSDEPALLVGG